MILEPVPGGGDMDVPRLDGVLRCFADAPDPRCHNVSCTLFR